MKTLRKILLIAAAGALAFFLGALILGNDDYWIDMRKHAQLSRRAYYEGSQPENEIRVEWCGGEHPAYVVFDKQKRQVIEAYGVTPIHFDRKNMWGIWSYEAFVEAYGEPQTYVDSTKMWITDDGYIISLWRPGEWVYPFPIQATNLSGEIDMYDLLTTSE